MYAVVFCLSILTAQQCEIKTLTEQAGWRGAVPLTQESCIRVANELNVTQGMRHPAGFECIARAGWERVR